MSGFDNGQTGRINHKQDVSTIVNRARAKSDYISNLKSNTSYGFVLHQIYPVPIISKI